MNVSQNFLMAIVRHGSGDAGDFLHAAGEREKALKCGCLPRNAGDLTGLHDQHNFLQLMGNQHHTLSEASSVEKIVRYYSLCSNLMDSINNKLSSA